MTGLSNSLADLAERIRDADRQSCEAERSAIEKALEAGHLLCDAKRECRYGDWGPLLQRARVHERKARRLMQLARSGLKPDTVSALGGIRFALEWLSTLPVAPQSGSHVLVSLDGFSGEYDEPFVVITPRDDGDLWIYRFYLGANEPWWEQPRRPVKQDAMWPIVFTLLDNRALEMRFASVNSPTFDTVVRELLGKLAGGAA